MSEQIAAPEDNLRPPPRHVAIIMDGNGRWAQRQGLTRHDGHRQGVENVREIVQAAHEVGLEVLTLYAFSRENWRRPKQEVDALMELLDYFLKTYAHELHQKGLRLRTIGQLDELPAPVAARVREVEASTTSLTAGTLVLALNYGSRTEVVAAARAFAEAVARGEARPEELTWERFADRLDTADIPDPDMIIRTSGEFRISNFLLMQGAYAELYFSPKCWPEFGPAEFREAIAWYRLRERRFGLTGEQVRALSGKEAAATVL